LDSLEVLQDHSYLKIDRHLGGIAHIIVTVYGFFTFSQTYFSDFVSIYKQAISLIVNRKMYSSKQLMDELSISVIVANNIFEYLSLHRKVNLCGEIGKYKRIFKVNASLRRELQDL
jgi:amino acid permease